MALTLKVRCTNCNQRFQDAPGTCPVCSVTDKWEPCVHESAPTGVDPIYRHPSGVAFFAYEEAAKNGAPVPAWAASAIPANTSSSRRTQLEARVVDAITANATFLAIASPTNAQTLAQVRALTRQWNAFLRLQRGILDAVD